MKQCYRQTHRLNRWFIALAMTVSFVSMNCLRAQSPQNGDRSASDRAVKKSLLTSTVAEIEARGKNSIEVRLEPLPSAESAPVVTAMSASHDGRYLAIAGDDHVIRLFDVESERTVRELSGHTDWIQALEFSADSQQLYSSGNDGRVLRWQHRYPVAAEEIVHLEFAIRSLSLSSERQWLAVGGFSNEIGIWDLSNQSWKTRLQCECGDQRCVRFSPAGDRLLCGGRDGCLRVWDTVSGELIFDKKLHNSRVSTAAFSSDGNLLTSAAEDRRLIQVHLATGETRLDLELGPARFKSLCLINDNLVAVAGSDNSIVLFDMLLGGERARLDGHFGTVAVMCPCGQKLASGSFDTTVRIWDYAEVARENDLKSLPVSRAKLDVDASMRIR